MHVLFYEQEQHTQVTYSEVPIASVGSLSYAEDDGRHILGIKALRHRQQQSGTGMEVGMGDSYCCHVFECGSEVSLSGGGSAT